MLNNKVDRKEFSVISINDKSGDLEYWLSKTPAERMEALEYLRQMIYGYEPNTHGLQRFFEVDELKAS